MDKISTSTINSFISKTFGLVKMKKEKNTTRDSSGTIAYKYDTVTTHINGDFWVEKYYGNMYYIHLESERAVELCVEITDELVKNFNAKPTKKSLDDLEYFAKNGILLGKTLSINF